jgi:hypothetical protein
MPALLRKMAIVAAVDGLILHAQTSGGLQDILSVEGLRGASGQRSDFVRLIVDADG